MRRCKAKVPLHIGSAAAPSYAIRAVRVSPGDSRYARNMIAVLQRVTEASVTVGDDVVGQIHTGLLALAAVERGDGQGEADWMAEKIAGLRAFPEDVGDKRFDRDVRQIDGAVLLVSNFTVAASCVRGRRPTLDAAAAPEQAEPVFAHLVAALRAARVRVETGRFGAAMRVALVNDGPVTFLLQTRQ